LVAFRYESGPSQEGRRITGIDRHCGILAPILYFLSLGPAAYFHDRGHLSDETAEVVYAPIMLLADGSETFRAVCEGYCDWFLSLSGIDE
jgi:hypothetical protein